jgi:hypothetical protein
MAFNCNFYISTTMIPGGFTINDNSDGTDPNITARIITVQEADGRITNYDWPTIEGDHKTLNILSVDKCLMVGLVYTSTSPLPPPSEYSKEGLFVFTGNSWQFLDSLIEVPASDYTVTQDNVYVGSFLTVYEDVIRAERAALTGQQMAAQSALNRVRYYIVNKQNFF